MIDRMGLVQSTSVVVFLGTEMRGDWNAMMGRWAEEGDSEMEDAEGSLGGTRNAFHVQSRQQPISLPGSRMLDRLCGSKT